MDAVRIKLYLCALVGACVLCSDALARTWTHEDGRTLEASFVRLDEGVVVLRDENRKTVRIHQLRLTEEDRLWIRRYRELRAKRAWESGAVKGSLMLLREDHAVIKVLGASHKTPYSRMTQEELEHAVEYYTHLEKELPVELAKLRGAASARQSGVPPQATATAPPEDAAERTWTDARGREIVAAYLGTAPTESSGPVARLWMKGREFRVPLSRLSEGDRRWIAEQNLSGVASLFRGFGLAGASR